MMNRGSAALAVMMSLSMAGLSSAQPDGLQGEPLAQQTEGVEQQQVREFMDWAMENPERLQATLEELQVEAPDLQQLAAEDAPEAPGAEIAGTYVLRKIGQPGSTATLEITPDLHVTRTVRNDKRVTSKLEGQGSLENGRLKVRFGKEQVEAKGAARKIGRLFKKGWRKVRQAAEVRDASYRFPGSGVVRGRILGMPERGYSEENIQPLAGTYLLPCATLRIDATSDPRKFRVTRTDHTGKVLKGKGKLKRGALSVRFDGGHSGRYVARVDRKKITGSFSRYEAYPVDREDREDSINDSGWRAGVTPEPTWLQRGFAKMKVAMAKLKAKVTALVKGLAYKVKAGFVALAHKTRALLSAVSGQLKAAMAGLMRRIEIGAAKIRARLERS